MCNHRNQKLSGQQLSELRGFFNTQRIRKYTLYMNTKMALIASISVSKD